MKRMANRVSLDPSDRAPILRSFLLPHCRRAACAAAVGLTSLEHLPMTATPSAASRLRLLLIAAALPAAIAIPAVAAPTADTSVEAAAESPAATGGGQPVQLAPVIATGTPAAPAVQTATKIAAPLAEIPQSITVIGRESLDEQNAQSLNQALRFVPGVQSEQFGLDNVFDFFAIRGFRADDTGVFRDGLLLFSPASGFAAFRLEPYGVERIEVLRGPASVLYGSANPGGLVNYVSKQPPATAQRELQLEVGSFDWKQVKADVGGPLGAVDGLQYRLTGLYRDSGTQVDFEQNDRAFIAPSLSWQIGPDTRLTVLGQYQNDDAGHLQFLPAAGTVQPNPNGRISTDRNDGEPGYNGFDREQWSAGWIAEHRFNAVWSVRQQFRYDHLDTAFRDVFGLGLDPADDSQRTLLRASFSSADRARAAVIDSNLTGRFGGGRLRHTVLAGIDYQHIDYAGNQGFGEAPSLDLYAPGYGAAIDVPALFVDTATKRSQVGLYVQEQAKLDERWLLLLGGRQDFVTNRVRDRLADSRSKQDDSKRSGRVGLSYRFDLGLVPYVNYATSFLPVIGSDSAGRGFQPETGRQWETGAKLELPTLRSLLTLAGFHIERQNVLTPSPDPEDPFGRVQTGAVRSQGVEFGAESRPLPGLHLTAAYTWQDVEVTRSNAGNRGLRPVATPEHLASLHTRYALLEGPLAGLGLSAAVRYQGATAGDDLNTLKVAAYTLFDAGIDYGWRGLRFGIYAQNLGNNTHVAACQAGSCFYGVDRTVTGTVAYRW